MTQQNIPEGGIWLVNDTAPESVFTPSDYSEEQRAIAAAIDEFVKREVAPNFKKLDSHDHALLLSIMAKAGENGFLGIEVPEAYGGLGQGLVTACLALERVGASGCGSFGATFGAHTGIGTTPVLLYGTEAQRAKWLPKLASGEVIGAYALTEPGSGSDALAAKTSAKLSIDQSRWIVNGDKLFITNAGFAGLFSVFVKIDGKNSCLLVERNSLGFSVGREEEKIGLRGSSTCPITFENALVERGNLLGEIGKGHKIVMNTLNIGRLKLAAGKVGLMKTMLAQATAHAAQRKQFGSALIEYDAIRAKLADIATQCFVGEAMVYRTAKLMEDRIHAGLPLEQLSQECALVKVALSEWGCNAVDEALQIHGGIGFIEEYPVATAYRDARVSRIYEGTSEINRFAAVDGIAKQVLGGKLNLLAEVTRLQDADAFEARLAELPCEFDRTVARIKAVTAFTVGKAMQAHMMGLAKEQQLLLALADMLIATYALESGWLRFLRVTNVAQKEWVRSAGYALDLYAEESAAKLERCAETVLWSLPSGGADDAAHAKRLLNRRPANVVALRREVAKAVAEKGGYPF